MPNKYASETAVPTERSRSEIEHTLKAYGATSFGYGWQSDGAIIVFEFQGRRMKFVLPLPTAAETKPAHRNQYSKGSSATSVDKETRRRWRALFLSIKAKLVTVSEGISTVETEFMGHIVLPNGMTVSEWMHPQIESAYKGGKMPPLLGDGLGQSKT